MALLLGRVAAAGSFLVGGLGVCLACGRKVFRAAWYNIRVDWGAFAFGALSASAR